MSSENSGKAKNLIKDASKSSFQKYRDLFYGSTSLGHVLNAEMITAMTCAMPGALGFFLRSKLYPSLFKSAGKKVFIGKNVTFRHFKKITIGNNVIIDDNCLIDAKGTDNNGIVIEDDVFIGRNSTIYCKNGDMHIKKGANISSNCTLFSSNKLTIGEGNMIGGYSYLLSGGEYDYKDKETKFADQSGKETKGELTTGSNCWLGARVSVLDAACIGENSVIGAGAVVTKPIPKDSMAVGVPAKVVKSI